MYDSYPSVKIIDAMFHEIVVWGLSDGLASTDHTNSRLSVTFETPKGILPWERVKI